MLWICQSINTVLHETTYHMEMGCLAGIRKCWLVGFLKLIEKRSTCWHVLACKNGIFYDILSVIILLII